MGRRPIHDSGRFIVLVWHPAGASSQKILLLLERYRLALHAFLPGSFRNDSSLLFWRKLGLALPVLLIFSAVKQSSWLLFGLEKILSQHKRKFTEARAHRVTFYVRIPGVCSGSAENSYVGCRKWKKPCNSVDTSLDCCETPESCSNICLVENLANNKLSSFFPYRVVVSH